MKLNAANIAVILFIALCLVISMWRGTKRELANCRMWSQRAYNLLPPEQKKILQEKIELYREMEEVLIEEPYERY